MRLAEPSFWQVFETHFPLGGARRYLREQYGQALVDGLESQGLLQSRGSADRYPCPRRNGECCPRFVVDLDDGRIEGVCGNDPPACDDVQLTEEDIEVLELDVGKTYSAIAKELQIVPKVEELPSLRHAYRIGTFKPDPGVLHSIYMVVRCGTRDYAECIDALQTHAVDRSCAVLVPTERFISEEILRRAAAAGTPVIPIESVLGMGHGGRIERRIDPLVLFKGIGQRGGDRADPPVAIARAFVGGRGRTPRWQDLDDKGYEQLVATAGEYDVFADATKRTTIAKTATGARTKKNVPASYFRLVRAALEAQTAFDPVTDDRFDELRDPKQLFQRARLLMDIPDKNDWTLFKTEMVDNRAVYRFTRDTTATFAFIFEPIQ